MKHWFRDAHFRSLLKNSGYLAGSKAVAAVAGIATLAFAGRGLGVALFGTLILPGEGDGTYRLTPLEQATLTINIQSPAVQATVIHPRDRHGGARAPPAR